MTALLAVTRAGCAVVPLDPEYPEERIRSILTDAECMLCVTTFAMKEKVGKTTIVLLEDVFGNGKTEGSDDLEVKSAKKPLTADISLNLSDWDIEGFLIFTSGSTGKPKGVIYRQSVFSCGKKHTPLHGKG